MSKPIHTRRQINLVCLGSMVAGLIMGGIVGGHMREAQIIEDQQRSWDNVMVLQGGTVVANPAALTPAQLSNATIVDPFDHVTICTDVRGETFVNPKDGECEQFKEIQFASTASE